MIAVYVIMILMAVGLVANAIRIKKRNSEVGNKHWEAEEKEELRQKVAEEVRDAVFSAKSTAAVEARIEEIKAEPQVPHEAFVFVKYRGEVLPMRLWEKREYWDNYTREDRNRALADVKRAVKQGKLKKEWIDGNVYCYVPVSGDLRKIREDYKKFAALGGELKEEIL